MSESTPLLQRRNSWLVEQLPASDNEVCNVCLNKLDSKVTALYHQTCVAHPACVAPWLAIESSCITCRHRVSMIQTQDGQLVPVPQRRQPVSEDYVEALSPFQHLDDEEIIVDGDQIVDVAGRLENQRILAAHNHRVNELMASFRLFPHVFAIMRLECIPFPLRMVLAFFALILTPVLFLVTAVLTFSVGALIIPCAIYFLRQLDHDARQVGN